MPLLAGLFLSLFSGLAGLIGNLLGQHVSKKLVFGMAAVGTFGVLTVGLWLGMSLAIQGLVSVAPTGPLAIGLWAMIPDSAPAVVSAVIAADVAVTLYRWNVTNLKLASWV